MSRDHRDLLCLDLPKAEELRQRRLSPHRAREVATRWQAVADPTRLMLVAALAESDELCVCDLSWVVERAENLISHHMRKLHEAGVVRRRRAGKMVMYSLTPEGRALVGTALRPDAAAASL